MRIRLVIQQHWRVGSVIDRDSIIDGRKIDRGGWSLLEYVSLSGNNLSKIIN